MAKKATKALDPTLPIYQLKISLQHTHPIIWRRVQMDDCSLDELHDIIQIAMGWEDEHMHAFVIDGAQYGDIQRGGDFDHDSRSVQLSDLVQQGHKRFRYDYDFGDDWTHTIDIEKTLPAEEGVYYPWCVKGERACPPEDCGGPYGYLDLLEILSNPQHDEYAERLEWVGGQCDPEKFDLEVINADLYYLRRFLGHHKGKHTAKAAFIKGDLVQVKPGIVNNHYPDIPLGGWVGNITKIAWLTPVGYEIRWTKPTLEQAHAVYLKRCQRDGIPPDQYWLEADHLEEASEEMPTTMEQPTNIITRPLSTDDIHDRIRMMFGLTTDDPLPPVDEQNQEKFLDYLKANLTFPFKAEYSPESSDSRSGKVTILGFADPPIDPDDGIVCEVCKGKSHFQAPLSNMQVHEDEPNFQHVADYTYWLWDAQNDEDFEDDEDGDDFDEDPDDDDDGMDDEETIGNVLPIPDELIEMVNAQRQKFLEKFGRKPGPNDKLFFDAPPLEEMEHMIVQAMKQVGVDPAIIHAFEKTGLIVTEANQHLLKGVDLDQWNAAIEEFTAKGEEAVHFPIGTIVYYGPNDKTTTKIVAGVIKKQGAKAIIKCWVATDVMSNPKFQREVEKFFKKHGVKQVAVSDGNMGCPHEEGEDFPVGEDCPFCPWWKGKQGSGAKE